MIGSMTFCCVCKNPMRSCMVPAVCVTCEAKEREEKLSKEADKPIIVRSAIYMSAKALESGASEEEIQ